MTRKEELLKILSEADVTTNTLVINLVDDVVFLEHQLEYLRTCPFIKVHPRNPELQKPTVASKQYKELLQQYNNIIKLLCSLIHKGESGDDESPLRAYMRKFNK